MIDSSCGNLPTPFFEEGVPRASDAVGVLPQDPRLRGPCNGGRDESCRRLSPVPGYAQCAFLAPDVFRMHGEEALMYSNPTTPSATRCCAPRRPAPSRPFWSTSWRAGTRRWGRRRHEHCGYLQGFKRDGRVVIVGASLAGLRAAEALRDEGFTGKLTMIGDELGKPDDRPPLSKQVLTGWVPADGTTPPRRRDIDAEWLLGVPADGLDLANNHVRLADGRTVPFDRMLISTGVRARPWPVEARRPWTESSWSAMREDAAGLQRAVAAGPSRVLIIGAGFTGSEIASVCRERDIPVTVAELAPSPLVGDSAP